MKRTMIAAFFFLPISLSAQWLDFKTPGIPRTADGKPNLTAPAPRTADGHPDLSGLWQPQLNTYWLHINADIFDESAFTPDAEAVTRKRTLDDARDWPGTHCLPLGPGAIFAEMFRIIQSPTVVALLLNVQYEGGGSDEYRQIFLDGRELPKDPNPTWRGYSVGHWEGDTLVVETAGFNDRSWLDGMGHPHSENLRVIERFHRVDLGHMALQITFEDPEMLTHPLTISLPVNYQPDTAMLEWECENERDTPHLAVPKKQGVNLSPETLAKYTGAYKFAGGAPLHKPWLPTLNFSTDGGRLYVGAFPLTPNSETTFESGFGNFEFSVDNAGMVKSLTVSGGLKYVQKR